MSNPTSIAQDIARARILANAENKNQAVVVLGQCVEVLRGGGAKKQALGKLNANQRKRLNNFAKRHGVDVDQILAGMLDGTYTIGEIAEATFTDSGRQSDGEKHFHSAYRDAIGEQTALLDAQACFLSKLPGGFLSNGPTGSNWKGLDFHLCSFSIHELVSHKYTNGSGGSQTNSNNELMRLAAACSPYNEQALIQGDWEVHHFPHTVEQYFRKELEQFSGQEVHGIILAVIQDGVGREKDLDLMRRMAQSSMYQGSPLIVFAGNREQYFLSRPLLFILMKGWESFSEAQQIQLRLSVEKFHQVYPQGFGGLKANPEKPWEVLADE